MALAPANFFGLSTPVIRRIFDGCVYAWEPLVSLEQTMQSFVQTSTVIRGSVMEGAFVAERWVWIEEGAVVEAGAYIAGPAYIGKDAEVRHGAYIRGNVILMEGAVLGHASEAKNSIFLPEAKAPHFAYVGDSILGARVNLGAGTKLSNLAITSTKDGITGKRPTIVVGADNASYDTKLSKFGAIFGDDSGTGCNCVINPGTLIGKRTLVYPNVSVRRGYYPPDCILKLRQELEQTPRHGAVHPTSETQVGGGEGPWS
jgi:NDP-sugar pyrophosphorylase family protein